MIISVEKLNKYITTDKSDEVLEDMLQALELLIRRYTNNNFQNRNKRFWTTVSGGKLGSSSPYIKNGDTIQITESMLNDGLYIYSDSLELLDEKMVLVTKVEYPMDVQMGVVDMIRWDLDNRSKVGIQSETISRHSVTYFNMDGDNSIMGYPKSLLGFLEPYKKARF